METLEEVYNLLLDPTIKSHLQDMLEPPVLFSEFQEVLENVYHLWKSNRLYRRFSQEVRGKRRDFSVPNNSFKTFCKNYLFPFIQDTEVHKNAHGAEKCWSPASSLSTHLPFNSCLALDLKNAFENLPYNLVEAFYSKYSPEVSEVLALLSTVPYEDKRGIPQGSNFGPALFNRSLYDLDVTLTKKAEERGMKYTRWVDDMTFSSVENLPPEDFLGAMGIIEKYMPISQGKIFYQEQPVIYLLGQKIKGSNITKNSKEERTLNKKPLSLDGITYESW